MPGQTQSKHTRLGEFSSTAIAGNDILSSVLYVTGISIIFAGVYSPLIFLLIGVVLWLYKHVYTEVVEALPLNGGAYNCLLNATSKTFASIAGVMAILSFVATSVISAKTAAEYLNTVIDGIPILIVTAAIIVFFAGLVIAGVKESSKVAMAIFVFHVVTLFLFIFLGVLNVLNNGWGEFFANIEHTKALFAEQFAQSSINSLGMSAGVFKMFVLSFAASLLGITGYESSANFVEEQQPNVFRKTLRNMLIGVAIFNPLIAFVILTTMPLPEIMVAKDFILSDAAFHLAGPAFQYLMVADAFLVLSGAVLTSFVGASGLMYRMTLDHCLPSSILLPRLRSKQTHVRRIIFAFTALCISILLVTRGNLLSLAGVYTISFLGVMSMFALGNLILRVTRPDLKRTYQGPVVYVILAALSTILGVIGNILIDSNNVLFFCAYFFPALCLVLLMIYRDYVLEYVLRLMKPFPFLRRIVQRLFDHVTRPKIIVFAHTPAKLYKSLSYVQKNETSRHIVIVYCKYPVIENRNSSCEGTFEEYIRFFKEARVFPLFSFEFVVEEEQPFGPEVVRKYANRFRLSLNNVFVGSIHKTHEFTFEDLGGVRIIQ